MSGFPFNPAGDGILSRIEKHLVEGPEDLVLGILLLRNSAESSLQEATQVTVSEKKANGG